MRNMKSCEMETVMSTPEKRQFEWNRRLAQLDYNSQIDSARSEGRAEGRAEGKTEGENRFAALMTKLFSMGMTQEAEKAANDPAYLHQLLVEFGMVEA